MQKLKLLGTALITAGALCMSASNGFAFASFGANVNTACAPQTPFTGDCTLCHIAGDFAAVTDAKTAYLAGGTALTDFFCPGVACTDADQDTYAVEGGECGPIDCNDMDPAINPGAPEICTDGIDNNCNGLIDAEDPMAVGCPPDCTDNDGDGFAVEGGNCGPIDCDDTDADINPDAVEICTDGIDNNCNDLIDAQDPTAVDCPPDCTDNDGDTYAIEGGTCGPIDCNDMDAAINPGAMEICDDQVDNNCNGEIDEGCDVTCPDADDDGYQDQACGGTDCNDADPAINPGAEEICGNGIDENCNGMSDDVCIICPDGSLLVVKKAKYVQAADLLMVQGRATVGTTVTIMNADNGEVLADDIMVKGGKWKTVIRNVSGPIMEIVVMTSNGCTVNEMVRIIGLPGKKNGKDHDDDDGDDDDDDEDDNGNGKIKIKCESLKGKKVKR